MQEQGGTPVLQGLWLLPRTLLGPLLTFDRAVSLGIMSTSLDSLLQGSQLISLGAIHSFPEESGRKTSNSHWALSRPHL